MFFWQFSSLICPFSFFFRHSRFRYTESHFFMHILGFVFAILGFVFRILHFFMHSFLHIMHIFVFYVPIFDLNYTLLFAYESLLFFVCGLVKLSGRILGEMLTQFRHIWLVHVPKIRSAEQCIQLGDKIRIFQQTVIVCPPRRTIKKELLH